MTTEDNSDAKSTLTVKEVRDRVYAAQIFINKIADSLREELGVAIAFEIDDPGHSPPSIELLVRLL